jgi:histidinol phosphatase-like PHP family hydrolase
MIYSPSHALWDKLYPRRNLSIIMKKGITFYAVATDANIPDEIRRYFDERLEIRNVFGTKCYVILEDEEKSPLNLLDEEFHRKVERWLAMVSSDKVFACTWKP